MLSELAESIDPAKLSEAAATAPLIRAQRLGYLLELAGAGDAALSLKDYVRGRVRDYTPLASDGPKQGDEECGLEGHRERCRRGGNMIPQFDENLVAKLGDSVQRRHGCAAGIRA